MRTLVLHTSHPGNPPRVPVLELLALVMLVLGSLAGCVTTGSSSSSSPSPSSPAPTASAPPHTPLFSTDNQALVAATHSYAAYLRVSDEIYADGGIRPDRLRQVATNEALQQLEPDFLTYAERHWHISGNTSFDSVRLQGTSARAVTIYVCEDVSNINVLDASGTSLIGGNGDTRLPFQAQLVQRGSRLVLAAKTAWTGKDFCR